MTKFLLILLTISVNLGFTSSDSDLEPEGESLGNLQSIAAALSDIESESEAAYNESVEYYRHYQASKRFFRRLSKNPRAISVIEDKPRECPKDRHTIWVKCMKRYIQIPRA